MSKKKKKLKKYKVGQHDLICEATNTGKHYSDPGNTAYESVCILLTKIDVAKRFLKKQRSKEAKKILNILEKNLEAEEFDVLALY
jgi:hypothetical protein